MLTITDAPMEVPSAVQCSAVRYGGVEWRLFRVRVRVSIRFWCFVATRRHKGVLHAVRVRFRVRVKIDRVC